MAGLNFGKKVWFDGKTIDFENAQVSILSHALHYGSCVFEGLRTYKTKKGSAIFRLEPHIRRLYESAKIYRMNIPLSQKEFCDKVCETVRANKFDACYVRPFVFRGLGDLGLNPLSSPIHVSIAVWEWGAYLGADSIEAGIDVKFSSWNRIAPNTFPAMAKAAGNYLHSQLMKMEAVLDGYAESIILDHHRMISERSGENIFIIRDGKIYTPPMGASILLGITRDVVKVLARDMKIEVIEENIPREFLTIADEAFFTGTAAEIAPIRSVDKIPIGNGKRGPITEKIQERFFRLVKGEEPDLFGWLKYL